MGVASMYISTPQQISASANIRSGFDIITQEWTSASLVYTAQGLVGTGTVTYNEAQAASPGKLAIINVAAVNDRAMLRSLYYSSRSNYLNYLASYKHLMAATTSTYSSYLGLFKTTSIETETEGSYFKITSVGAGDQLCECVSVAGGTATTTTATSALSNAAHIFQILSYPGSDNFYIDGVRVATHTTNLSTDSMYWIAGAFHTAGVDTARGKLGYAYYSKGLTP